MIFEYKTKVGTLPNVIATVKKGRQYNPLEWIKPTGRTIIKGGMVVDPANNIEEVKDISIFDKYIQEVGDEIKAEKGDRIIDASGLLVVPGLIDMHLHLGDLFEVTTNPIYGAVADGVTLALSPGAGNTFMAPSLLGAEVDRGVPMNIGVYLGELAVMGCALSVEELISLFKGELDEEIAFQKMTRNRITYLNAPLTVGLKDHTGHWLASDELYDKIFEVTSKAGLIYMSHTQDPDHAERLVDLSKGRPIHLAHATAAGCGTHTDPVEGMKRVVKLAKWEHVSAEFITTMLRPDLGSRESIKMTKESQKVAYEALSDGAVNILISDGQNDATMKGGGDTRDNIPCLIELADMGVLSLSESIATMTANPARLIAKLTKEDWWIKELGHLGPGARANVTIIDRDDKLATWTIVNGRIAGFENRTIRRANGAGGWVSKFGILDRIGVGDLTVFGYA